VQHETAIQDFVADALRERLRRARDRTDTHQRFHGRDRPAPVPQMR
jgi:hypothetical protein